MKKKNIKFIVLSILITISFGVIGYFIYKNSYLRISESLIDLFYSIKYYFCTLLQIDSPSNVTVESYSKYITSGLITPETNQEFVDTIGSYFSLFFSKDNFLNWLRQFTININHLAKVFILVAPVIMALILVINKIYRTPNNDFNKDTIPLKIYKSISNVFYMPTKAFLKDYFAF